MSSYVKRVGDLTEPVELSASQITEKMTSTVDSEFDPVTKPAHYAGHTGIECKQAMESMLGTDEYVSYMQAMRIQVSVALEVQEWHRRPQEGARVHREHA